jgi:hypothetical protein
MAASSTANAARPIARSGRSYQFAAHGFLGSHQYEVCGLEPRASAAALGSSRRPRSSWAPFGNCTHSSTKWFTQGAYCGWPQRKHLGEATRQGERLFDAGVSAKCLFANKASTPARTLPLRFHPGCTSSWPTELSPSLIQKARNTGTAKAK